MLAPIRPTPTNPIFSGIIQGVLTIRLAAAAPLSRFGHSRDFMPAFAAAVSRTKDAYHAAKARFSTAQPTPGARGSQRSVRSAFGLRLALARLSVGRRSLALGSLVLRRVVGSRRQCAVPGVRTKLMKYRSLAAVVTLAFGLSGLANGEGMQHIGHTTLIPRHSNPDDKGIYAAAIDPANGYAYFVGTYLYKLDITGNLDRKSVV